jgi:hypothetical protein
VRRNCQIDVPLEYFGQVGTRNLGERGCTCIILVSRFTEFSEQGCARIFWLSRYVEFEGKEGALNFFKTSGRFNVLPRYS